MAKAKANFLLKLASAAAEDGLPQVSGLPCVAQEVLEKYILSKPPAAADQQRAIVTPSDVAIQTAVHTHAKATKQPYHDQSFPRTALLNPVKDTDSIDAPHLTGIDTVPLQSFASRGLWDPQQTLDRTTRTALPHAGPLQKRLPAKSDSRRRSHASGSISLNKQIMAASTPGELLALVQGRTSQFDFFNISSALARVPKLVSQQACNAHIDGTTKSLVEELAKLMAASVHTFDARGLANAAWAFGKLKYNPVGELPSLIAREASSKIESFSPQNLSNMLWAFVYLRFSDENFLRTAAQQVCKKVGLFKPQELANVIWAFASVDFYDRPACEAIADRCLQMVDHFKEQELSNVIWAFGKLHHYNRQLFCTLLDESVPKLSAFLPQGVSNIAWSLATVGHHDNRLFDNIVAKCGAHLSSFDVQALSNIVWAMASLGYRHTGFLDAAMKEALARSERMTPQNTSNILWGCATLGHCDRRALSLLTKHAALHATAFEPQGLANTVWAFARLGAADPMLYSLLADASLARMDSFSPQGLSNLVWAFATTGNYNELLYRSVASNVMRTAGGFNAQNCSVTLWAMATGRHVDWALQSLLLQRLVEQLPGCEPQNVANALWAAARTGRAPGAAVAELAAHACRLAPAMHQRELCNSFWAMGVLNLLTEDTFRIFCRRLAEVTDLPAEAQHQAFHTQLMYQSWLQRQGVAPSSAAAKLCLPEPLLTTSRNLWESSAQDVHVSRFQQEVSEALSLAGVPSVSELLTEDRLFSIDIAFTVGGQRVAVEVDGAHHYSANAPHVPLSDVAVRRRLLQDRGWRVTNIGFAQWEAWGAKVVQRAQNLIQLVAHELAKPLAALPAVAVAPPAPVLAPPTASIALPTQPAQALWPPPSMPAWQLWGPSLGLFDPQFPVDASPTVSPTGGSSQSSLMPSAGSARTCGVRDTGGQDGWDALLDELTHDVGGAQQDEQDGITLLGRQLSEHLMMNPAAAPQGVYTSFRM